MHTHALECQITKEYNIPITFASSSVSVLLRKIFFTRRVFPEGRTTPVVGIGGSPSFCCKLSAMTRKTLRPIFILFNSKKGNEKERENRRNFNIKVTLMRENTNCIFPLFKRDSSMVPVGQALFKCYLGG